LHFSWLLQRSQSIPGAVWILTIFILVFTFAIAIFKDIPDMEGDKLYHITTFTIQLGQKKVFNLAIWVLTTCYLGMILSGVFTLNEVNKIFLLISHIIPLSLLWIESRKVDIDNKTQIADLYQFIWKLFFIEYLIFPIAGILG
ncbi:MAG: UbiA family prenyltransferase, partial [Sphaerospermopsis sp. SIO1G2]|nr:UbiA family prenyltransferase [Sphaerospermopsis sp. SIO1G2]